MPRTGGLIGKSTNVRVFESHVPDARGSRPREKEPSMPNAETPRSIVPHDRPEITRHCGQCGESLAETWPDSPGLCLRCGLEADLFDREARWERLHGVEARSA
jgi:hypothetical protein